jgi:1-deoxy-D-xylulose-5-phosphate reductoisomerase
VLNAADEVAVAAFLDGRLPFKGIPDVVERVLAEMPAEPVSHFEDLFATDEEARSRTTELIEEIAVA